MHTFFFLAAMMCVASTVLQYIFKPRRSKQHQEVQVQAIAGGQKVSAVHFVKAVHHAQPTSLVRVSHF